MFDAVLAQLPESLRARDAHERIPVLVRTGGRRCDEGVRRSPRRRWGAVLGRGVTGTFRHPYRVATLPKKTWTRAYQARKPRAAEHGAQIGPRDGAWVAEATHLINMSSWPAETRLILRKERPHPGAQPRITDTDTDGLQATGFLTNARVVDPVINSPISAIPRHEPKQTWLAITAVATELLAWSARLALPAAAALYEPKRLRLRILAVAGRIVTTARRRTLRSTQGLVS